MLINDPNQGNGGGEGADLPNGPDLENITEEEMDSHEGSGSDPYDAIADETVRKDAKKNRAIGRRISKHKANPPKPKTPVKPVSKKDQDDDDDDGEDDDGNEEVKLPKNAATKDDLKKIATNGAKKLVPEEVLTVWGDLDGIPLGGFDGMDEQSIAENYIRRYNVYIVENPGDSENPALPLQVSVIQKAGGKAPLKKAEGERSLPGYKEPVDTANWYPEEK